MPRVSIAAIQAIGRHRKDLGNITALAKSIDQLGLIHPIIITPDMRIIAGERRLNACQALGWAYITAHVVDNLDDAVMFLDEQRDENTEHKEMTISERVALAKTLEELDRPHVNKRKQEASIRARTGITSPQEPGKRHKTRYAPGRAVGLLSSSYYKAKAIVEAVNHPDPDVRAVAHAAMTHMDTSGEISGSYEKVRVAKETTSPGYQKPTQAPAAHQRKALNNAQITMSGLIYGIKQVGDIHPDITSEEAAQWVSGFSEARRTLESLIKKLRERTNA